MDVWATAVADEQTAEAVEPGEGALDFPAVATEAFSGFLFRASDAGNDASATAGRAVLRGVTGLVGVEFAWTLARSSGWTGDGLHGVEHAEVWLFILQHLYQWLGEAGRIDWERASVDCNTSPNPTRRRRGDLRRYLIDPSSVAVARAAAARRGCGGSARPPLGGSLAD